MKIRWKNIVQPDRPQLTIMRMRIACWTPKATNTHSVYVTLTAFVCPFSVLLQIRPTPGISKCAHYEIRLRM